MKNILFAALLPLMAALAGAADLKLVESVPEDTVYGSTGAARPQAVWPEMINSASRTLDIEQFYIAEKEGEDLTQMLDAIKACVKNGVKVRFIVDSVMMKESAKTVPQLEAAGVQVRVMDFKKAGGGVQHAKFFIVDGRSVFVGSQNFDWRSLKHIHELGLRIDSQKAASDFQRIFEADWAVAGGADPKKTYAKKSKQEIPASRPEKGVLNYGEVSYHLAFSPVGAVPAGLDLELPELLKMINGARKTLRGQVMTYALEEHGSKRWADLDTALRKAAARGVQVSLVLADWALGGKADRDIKALSKTPNISIKVSSLPEHRSGFIPYSRVEHCKYLVADGELTYVTTSNWGPGYFLTSRGAAVFIKGAAAAKVAEEIFDKAWNGPYAQPVDPLKAYQPVKRN
ncbi:MAG: phospholipase D-like domain-containing protein [Elusimicrobiales bacterium]|nr:phospholipase D-like domain-containing protein [Elusimicrobiales bacterium]